MAKRKAVMLEEELVDQLRVLAGRYGMSLSAYMRRLIRLAIVAETQGVHAPQAISRGITFSTLARLSLLPLPARLVEKYSGEELRELARKTGLILKSLDIDAFDLVALIAESSGLGFSTPNSIKLLRVPGDIVLEKLHTYLVELAASSGLEVDQGETGTVIIRRPSSGGSGVKSADASEQ